MNSMGLVALTSGFLLDSWTVLPKIHVSQTFLTSECVKYHKRIAELISNKTHEDYSKVMNHIRTRVRFTLLKSTLIAIRGERGKQKKSVSNNVSELSFNTVPYMPSYEV